MTCPEEVGALIEKVATEWAHQLQAVELEKNLWKSAIDDASVGIQLRSLNRSRATESTNTADVVETAAVKGGARAPWPSRSDERYNPRK
jgi:hypothetical protein